MIICYILIVLLCLYKIRFVCFDNKQNPLTAYYDDYMSYESTNAIKGIFILSIIFSHSYNQGLALSDSMLNRLYEWITFKGIGQSVVVMFLFYSGYGVMKSILNKGNDYICQLPKNRILKTLLHFDLILVVFFIVQTLLGFRYSVKHLLLTLIGYLDIGNSSWYIFAILLLYTVTYIAFSLVKRNPHIPIFIIMAFVVGYVFLMRKTDKHIAWYDTVFIFPVGMLFCLHQKKIDAFLKRFPIAYYMLFILSAAGVSCIVLFSHSFYLTEIKHFLFVVAVVLLTMKVKINNFILSWCGSQLFLLYMLQRLPMNILNYYHFNQYPVLYIAIVCISTVLLTYPFKIFFKKYDDKFFIKK